MIDPDFSDEVAPQHDDIAGRVAPGMLRATKARRVTKRSTNMHTDLTTESDIGSEDAAHVPPHFGMAARFILHHVRRWCWHFAAILVLVLSAAGCAIGSQYVLKLVTSVKMVELVRAEVVVG